MRFPLLSIYVSFAFLTLFTNLPIAGDEDTVVSIKGIDLESAMPIRGNPLDYTPEASPPEFARMSLEGRAYDFVLDYSYDVWSFGMLAYELATGRAYFRGKTPTQIINKLGHPEFIPPEVPLAIEDLHLREQIGRAHV